MTNIRAGKLRHSVEVQENQPTQDATGQEIENWVTVAKVWARIHPKKGREFIDSDQLKATEVTHMIDFRYLPLLTTKHRLFVDKARAFEIDQALNEDEREIMHNIRAKEIIR